MKNDSIRVKRDKGLFHRNDGRTIEEKIESELDNIAKTVNSAFKNSEAKTEKLVTQSIFIGGPVNPPPVIYDPKVVGGGIIVGNLDTERTVYGGENRTIIKDVAISYAPITNITTYAGTDTFEKNSHGLVNGDIVTATNIVTTTGISLATLYYVVGVTGSTFQLSLTSGGSPISLATGDGTCSLQKITRQVLTSFEPGDMLKAVTVITKTIDTGVSIFTLNDGTIDLFTLDDIDTTIISAATPARAMWREYTANGSLTMTIAGGSAFIARIVFEILRRPSV